jgi:uncharacterized OB-fold protein
MHEAAETLAEMDRLESSLDMDALIHREVSARKAKFAADAPKPSGEQAECPGCGSTNSPKSKFCAECGAKL